LSGIAGEAKPALVEALKLNANLNLLARMPPSDAIRAADLRRSAYKAWAAQVRKLRKARNPPRADFQLRYYPLDLPNW
jgi:hypothetical protein